MTAALYLLYALAALSFADWCVRLLLYVSSGGRPVFTPVPSKWLVLIPARDEGAHVRGTLNAVREEADRSPALTVTPLLLLDGGDEVAADIAKSTGAEVAIKMPPGPTKGAAVAWCREWLGERLDQFDAVLLLDVGSRLTPEFFQRFTWPEGATAVQCFLRGKGTGSGSAASGSEHLAQSREDRGRERLQWNVRLRGTGVVTTPGAFRRMAEATRTQIEDLEASLLLAAAGERCRMGPPAAAVIDDKPHSIEVASRQRARWFAGRFQLLFRRWDAFVSLLRRNPGEGLAFLLEIFGRPFALTVPLRAAAGLLMVTINRAPVAGTLLIVSAVVDAAAHVAASEGGVRSSGALFVAWVRAIFLAPRALASWFRTKR